MMFSRRLWHRQIVDENSIGGLTQDCSNSSALAMELLQSCTKLSIRGATSDNEVDIITTLNFQHLDLYLHKKRAHWMTQNYYWLNAPAFYRTRLLAKATGHV